MIAILRLGVQLLLKRIDQSLIIRAYPKISIPDDRVQRIEAVHGDARDPG
jgi:hypothetical protein